MKHAVISIVLCVMIAAAGFAVVKLAPRFRNAPNEAQAAVVSQKVINVKVQELKTAQVDDRLLLTGHVMPWEDIMVSAEARGKIEWQGVVEGQKISAGDELVKIDTSLLQAQMDQVQAQRKLATQELDRVETLSAKGIATAQAVDKIHADDEVSSAGLRLVQIQFEKSVVRAPIDGVIDTLFKDKQEFVDVGAPLARIVQVHKVKVSVGIPERDISFFAEGNPATVTLDALQGRSFAGVIHRIATTAEAATLTFIAEIEVDNPDGAIKPGMVARVALVRKSYPDSIIIPLFSILSLENMRFVFVEENGAAHGRPIQVGVLQDNTIQVTEGLRAGDRLIVSGQRDLKDGDPVNVIEVVE